MKSPRIISLTIKDVFGTRKTKRGISNSIAPDLQDSTESSLDSHDLIGHIGGLKVSFKPNDANSSNITEKEIGDINSRVVDDASPLPPLDDDNGYVMSAEERKKSLILFYKSEPNIFGESKPPSKPEKKGSFKMDGIPAFMNQQIESRIRRDTERRRKAREQKSDTIRTMFHESMISLSTMGPTLTRKQRPKVRFLNLPRDHPLFWDHNKLSTTDFPADERAFLANVLKNPMQKAGGIPISSQVQNILKKLHLKDWDTSTIGRSAMVLFHPDSNPLNLSPEVASYFFTRFNSLKTSLDEGVEVSYMDKTYNKKEAFSELCCRLRRDFEEATRRYEADHNKPFY